MLLIGLFLNAYGGLALDHFRVPINWVVPQEESLSVTMLGWVFAYLL
jgi:hypothetical protein